MALSISSFTEWLENDCQWHQDMNIDENGILTVTVVFDSSFPTLPAGYTWLADARLIAPSFRNNIDKYTNDYGRYVIFAYNFLESGFNPLYPQAERNKLSERGKIRKQSLDIYLSVGISFIVRDNTGNTGIDTCVARLFGIPKHFVSKDLL